MRASRSRPWAWVALMTKMPTRTASSTRARSTEARRSSGMRRRSMALWSTSTSLNYRRFRPAGTGAGAGGPAPCAITGARTIGFGRRPAAASFEVRVLEPAGEAPDHVHHTPGSLCRGNTIGGRRFLSTLRGEGQPDAAFFRLANPKHRFDLALAITKRLRLSCSHRAPPDCFLPWSGRPAPLLHGPEPEPMGDDDGVHDYDGGLTEDEDDPYYLHDKTKDKRNRRLQYGAKPRKAEDRINRRSKRTALVPGLDTSRENGMCGQCLPRHRYGVGSGLQRLRA